MRAEVSIARNEQYNLTRDAYTGSGGFANGDHLFSFGREIDPLQRKKMASYSNYLKPIISAQVDPIFTSPPHRTYESNKLLDVFMNDTDNNSTSLQELTRKFVTQTTLMGNFFVIMDNFPVVPQSEVEAVSNRILPYVYSKSLNDVKEYEVDEFGALVSITFFYGFTHNAELKEQEMVYREFTMQEVREYSEAKGRDGKMITNEMQRIEHNMGSIPIIYHNRDEITPFSPYYPIAKQSQKIFNAESETNDLARSQNFSILLIPSINAGGEQNDAVIIGTDNALFYDSETGIAPSYISPDSTIMESSLKYLENCTTTLIQSADVLGSTAVQRGSKAESGVALSFKFFGKQQALKNSARMGEQFERDIIEMFGVFINKTIDYDVVYDDRFTPTYDEVVMRLASMRDILSMNISEEVNKQIIIDIVGMIAVQNNWSEEVHLALVNSVVSGSIDVEKLIETTVNDNSSIEEDN